MVRGSDTEIRTEEELHGGRFREGDVEQEFEGHQPLKTNRIMN